MKKALALFLSLLPIALCSCDSVVTQSVYANADKYSIGTKEYAEPIKEINVDWICGSLTLVEQEGLVGALVNETNDLIDDMKVHSYCNDGVLDVRFFASGYRARINGKEKQLRLAYGPGLEKITINLTSGSLHADSINVNACAIHMTSGEARLSKINASTSTTISVTSGRMEIGALTTPEARFDFTSGTFKVTEANVKHMETYLTSGYFFAGFKAVESSYLQAASGDIRVKLPEEGGKVSVSKTTGSIHVNRAGTSDNGNYTFGEGSANISIKITSGSVTID